MKAPWSMVVCKPTLDEFWPTSRRVLGRHLLTRLRLLVFSLALASDLERPTHAGPTLVSTSVPSLVALPSHPYYSAYQPFFRSECSRALLLRAAGMPPTLIVGVLLFPEVS
jgi:hypothetical protein